MSSPEIAEVYIHYKVLRKAYIHFVKALPREAMGFLAGDRYIYRGKEYVEVLEYIPIKSKASEVHVEPLEGSLGIVGKKLAELNDLILVGWAHSHPGYGCFLSETDIKTQRTYFSKHYHIALVIDPLSGEYDIFKLQGDNYVRPFFKEVIKR